MQCTAKKTFRDRRSGRHRLIVQVKDNQPTLHQRSRTSPPPRAPRGSANSHDKGRNRDERRIVTVFDPAGKLADTDWQPASPPSSASNARVHPQRRNRAAAPLPPRPPSTSSTRRSPPPAPPRPSARIGRIENTSHYSRDVTFGEDRSRIRTNPGVFARLRSFAFNILKANQTSTVSQDRYRAALAGIDNLLKLIAIPQH